MELNWIEVAVLGLVNFGSVFAAVGVFRAVDNRRKRKVVESFIDQVQEKISTEMSFQDLAKRFEEGDGRYE